ncbi:Mu-like prophage major head subunit gpT family protein [Patescibacteria group bacterium]|nr:Mu-like prophage major head subunit gpT family protein [Patescibacteria group bacterium]
MPEFLEVMSNWEGFHPVGDRQLDEAAIVRTIELLSNKAKMPPHRWEYMMKEAITTSDFPYLFGQVIDRQMLAAYKAWVHDWQSYTKMGTAMDFNTWRSHKTWGNDENLPLVGEKGEYLVAPVGEGRYTGRVYKRGRQFDISWEAIVNDALNAFGDIQQRFARAAIRTEARFATSLYSSAAGPNVLLYGAPIVDVDGANVTNVGVLPLTIANLEATMQLMALQVDTNGEPISIQGMHLVVPPSLEFQARAILTSVLKQWTEVGAGGGIPVPTVNVIPQMGLRLHVDPFLPVVDATATDDTTWYLFADPSQGAAIEFRYLRGHETPEICMKASDKVTVAGGAISPFSGDFATDNIFYRVRIVIGGTQLDPRFTYAQVGP